MRAKSPPAATPALPPEFVAPSLATLAKEVPAGDLWAHEIKFDGYRIQARIANGDVTMSSRNKQAWTHRFSGLVKALAALKLSSAIFDGEVIVQDERGVSDFGALVDALNGRGSARMIFQIFDLLFLNGIDQTTLPLADRKAALSTLLKPVDPAGPLQYSDHQIGNGAQIFAGACKLGLEGIISKRLDKPYRSGRHNDWLKLKCTHSDEFVIAGYTDSTALKDAIGSLVAGFYDGTSLIYAGRVGTGFDRPRAHALWQMLQPLRIPKSPFKAKLDTTQRHGVIWVTPTYVAQVDYGATTRDGLLRHAAFKGLREDKPAAEVRRPWDV